MYNIQGYRVTKVTVPLKQILPKVTRFQKLRRLHRASADDFPNVPKVARLQKLRYFFKFPKTNLKVTRFHKFQRLHRASADDYS